MKYLITHNTEIISQGEAEEWGLTVVMPFDSLEKDFASLPLIDDPVIFFIPTIIDTNNPLNYNGANLALRILMYYVRCRKTNIDIVLIGNESERDFMLAFQYPNMMKIPGIHYIRFNKSIIRDYMIPQREMLLPEEYLPYLENLNLKLPSSFKSTHSLTNEWCLYKWNSFMGFEANTELLKGLYFDYLITVERLNRVANKTATEYLKQRIDNLPARSRLLVVDDNSGWHEFFKEMFPNPAVVDVHFLGDGFKKLKYEEIEVTIQQEIKSFQPDVIILDFRLMEDNDAEIKDDMKQISGYKILSKILKGTAQKPLPSFGRQVLMFTATSRIENILMLNKGNADGFILKEKPETYSGKEITKDLISHMISDLQTGFKRARFLIPLNEIFNKLELLLVSNSNDYSKELIQIINNDLYIVRNLFQKNQLSIEILESAYISLYNIFEEIKRDKHFVNFLNDYTLVVKANRDITVCSQKSSWIMEKSDDDKNFTRMYNLRGDYKKYCQKGGDMNFAISSLLLFRLGYEQVANTEWTPIRKLRNAIVHNENSQIERLNITRDVETIQTYILKMVQLIHALLDKKQIKEVVLQK